MWVACSRQTLKKQSPFSESEVLYIYGVNFFTFTGVQDSSLIIALPSMGLKNTKLMYVLPVSFSYFTEAIYVSFFGIKKTLQQKVSIFSMFKWLVLCSLEKIVYYSDSGLRGPGKGRCVLKLAPQNSWKSIPRKTIEKRPARFEYRVRGFYSRIFFRNLAISLTKYKLFRS